MYIGLYKTMLNILFSTHAFPSTCLSTSTSFQKQSSMLLYDEMEPVSAHLPLRRLFEHFLFFSVYLWLISIRRLSNFTVKLFTKFSWCAIFFSVQKNLFCSNLHHRYVFLELFHPIQRFSEPKKCTKRPCKWKILYFPIMYEFGTTN